MPATVPAYGTIKYNDVVLAEKDEVGTVTLCKAEARHVYDDGGRRIKHTVHRITVETVIAVGEGNLDVSMADAHIKLSVPGARFIFDDQGYGKIDTSLVQDIAGGPKPQLLTWEPLGNNAARLVWVVEVVLPPCLPSDFELIGTNIFAGRLTGASLSWAVSYDENCLATRTVNVAIEIARGSNANAVLADRAREAIFVPPLEGFKRTQSWTVAPDFRRATLTVVDREIESDNPYPVNTLDMKATHSVQSNNRALNIWTNRIDVEVKVTPGTTRAWGWFVFRSIVEDRINTARGASDVVIPIGVSAVEDIFGRAGRFSFQYTTTQPMQNILGTSGLWRPVPGTSWSQWKASIAGCTGQRPGRGLRLSDSTDFLVDVCNDQIVNVRDSASPPPSPAGQLPEGFCPPRPPESNSWLFFNMWLQVTEVAPMIEHQPLQPFIAQEFANALGGLTLSGPAALPSIQILQGMPTRRIRFRGMSIRAGFTTNVPRLVRVGNVIPEHVYTRTEEVVLLTCGDWHIYGRWWDSEYAVAGNVGTINANSVATSGAPQGATVTIPPSAGD